MSKVVVQILRAPIGGIRKHVFDIIDHLANKDVQQIFVTNVQDSDKDLPKYKNLKIIHIDIKDQPTLKDLKNIFAIYSQLKNFNVDIIHGHGAKGGIYSRILSLFLHSKCIYTPHGGSLHRVYGTVKNKIYDLIELFFVPFTDIFLFESCYSSNEFSKNICDVSKKSIINYNGVEAPKEIPRELYHAGAELRLASFGLLRNLKGHDIIVEACALLQKNNIPFSYTIFGQGEEERNLINLITKYNLSDFIFIKDYSIDVLDEMLKFDFIVHPSRFESFGYVPAEAMSIKIPVIVSNEGGLKEVVTPECGYISKSNTPESYFEILKQIFAGDPELASKISTGFTRVQNLFSKTTMLIKIEEIYFT